MFLDYIKEIDVDYLNDNIKIYYVYELIPLFSLEILPSFEFEGLKFNFLVNNKDKGSTKELSLKIEGINTFPVMTYNNISGYSDRRNFNRIKINIAYNSDLISNYESLDRCFICLWKTENEKEELLKKFKRLSQNMKLIRKLTQ